MGPADGEHEPDLQIPRGVGRPNPPALAGRARDRASRATDYRRNERSHLGQAGQTAALFPRGRHLEFTGADRDAEFQHALDGGGVALDSRCVDQHFDGTVPRICRRQAAGETARNRFRHAKLFHRSRRSRRGNASLDAEELVRRDE